MEPQWREGVLVDRAAEAQGTAICLHGFTRTGARLQHLAHRLTYAHVDVIRPTMRSLWWPRSMNSPRVVSELARALAPGLAGPVVVIGHSAGAPAGCRLSAELLERGVDLRGIVLVDGVESPTRHIERSWSAISHLRIRAVTAPSSPCNRHGALVDWLSDRVDGRFGTEVAGSTHGDVEGDPHVIYRLACHGQSDESTRRRVIDLVTTEALDLLGIDAPGTALVEHRDDRPLIGRL